MRLGKTQRRIVEFIKRDLDTYPPLALDYQGTRIAVCVTIAQTPLAGHDWEDLEPPLNRLINRRLLRKWGSYYVPNWELREYIDNLD